MAARPRVIIALPHPDEGAAVADWLSADGFEPVRRSTPESCAGEMQARPFDLLVADAALAIRRGLHTEGRTRNPLAVTILIGDATAATPGSATGGQTMYLTRPIDRQTLSCFASMAIIDRRPVRCSVRKAVNRFQAFANGVPAHLVDVSAEGMRLEVMRDRGAILPPHFTVRVPLIGVSIAVQRMWTRSSTGRTSKVWYGAALSQNRATALQGWRTFVDTIPAGLESSVPVSQ